MMWSTIILGISALFIYTILIHYLGYQQGFNECNKLRQMIFQDYMKEIIERAKE